ncbi:MAG: amino acid ABC transporter permease [Bosea sp. (in: a-proteobacteria)]
MDWLIGFYNYRVVGAYAPAFLSGFVVTLQVSAIALAIALGLGVLLAISRSFGPRWLGRISLGYVEAVRATPLLIQLYLLYFALGPLPLLGRLTELQAGVLALGLNSAAYFSEIIRAGIDGVPKGQREGARALGLGFMQTLRLIILPLAARSVSPPLIGQTAMLIKDSSIVSFIGVVELTGAGVALMSDRLLPNEGFITAAIGYLLIYLIALALVRRVERRQDKLSGGRIATRRRRW